MDSETRVLISAKNGPHTNGSLLVRAENQSGVHLLGSEENQQREAARRLQREHGHSSSAAPNPSGHTALRRRGKVHNARDVTLTGEPVCTR